MLWAQLVNGALLMVSLGIHTARYGQPKQGKHDSGDIFAVLICVAILLCAGAFDRIVGWPT